MMTYAVIGRDDFEYAIDAAHQAVRQSATTDLSAPLDATWIGRVNGVWDRIEHALRTAFQFGVEQARDLTEQAIKAAEALLDQAADRAEAVQQRLLAEMQAYLSTIIDRALNTVRPHLTIGGATIPLAGVEVSQKISLTGSLKISVTELIALTGGGELTVLARYERPTGGPAISG
ncbi:hypothetical protein AB0M12_19780 [Nocardia vinacea]|uniref:hypothetical protein n=1 Tax=Nocardia vinacea TaxID=96468 RepID=UPI0034443897